VPAHGTRAGARKAPATVVTLVKPRARSASRSAKPVRADLDLDECDNCGERFECAMAD
jgi:hypothetical protein